MYYIFINYDFFFHFFYKNYFIRIVRLKLGKK